MVNLSLFFNKQGKTLMLTFLICACSAIFLVPLISTQNPAIEQSVLTSGETWNKACNGNSCNLMVYSKIKNVYEDNKWKRVEEARSLKGSNITCVVNSDNIHEIECLDWNYTSISVRLRISDSQEINKDIPIKYYEYKRHLLHRK